MLLYLHGFASGPASTKAQLFRARLREHGAELVIPDLAPDFTHLTVTSMLGIVEARLGSEPATLLGSSLGGYLAALLAARAPARVRALVLFAPAFGFAARWDGRLGPEAMARWRAERTIPVFHYGLETYVPLDIGLIEDAVRYPDEPDPPCPALVFAGRHDDTVPLASVERFAAARAGRELVVLDSGHELTDVLAPMWERTLPFLRRVGAL